MADILTALDETLLDLSARLARLVRRRSGTGRDGLVDETFLAAAGAMLAAAMLRWVQDPGALSLLGGGIVIGFLIGERARILAWRNAHVDASAVRHHEASPRQIAAGFALPAIAILVEDLADGLLAFGCILIILTLYLRACHAES